MVRFVIAAREELDAAVEVPAPEHRVEVHQAVEEAPGDVAHHCPQERVGRDAVLETSFGRRPGDVDEVFVAREAELPERERPEARPGIGLAHLDRRVPGSACDRRFWHRHGSSPQEIRKRRSRPTSAGSSRPRWSAG